VKKQYLKSSEGAKETFKKRKKIEERDRKEEELRKFTSKKGLRKGRTGKDWGETHTGGTLGELWGKGRGGEDVEEKRCS